MRLALFQPDIPQNCGTLIRLTAAGDKLAVFVPQSTDELHEGHGSPPLARFYGLRRDYGERRALGPLDSLAFFGMDETDGRFILLGGGICVMALSQMSSRI